MKSVSGKFLIFIMLVSMLLFGSVLVTPSKAADRTFADGDVIVAISNGQVQWRDKNGVLVQTLTTAASGYTTGMAFDASGNLYVTNFSAQTVSKLDKTGKLLGTFGNGYDSAPESIVFDKDGNAYVGHADGARAIRKFDSSGTFLATFQVQTEARGSDWIDLADDQCTMYYTSEDYNVKRYNVCTNTQLANFNNTPLPSRPAYALRILSTGGVMVADTDQIVRLDTSGNVIKTYDADGENCWFALNIDPDAKSFWSADFCTANVYKFDLATGSVLKKFNTGTGGNTVFGLTVKGEITAAQPCALPAFGDAFGNPVRQNYPQELHDTPYGGHEFTINGKTVFLPFRSGERDNSIARWGCYLTSGAMVINYFAAQQGSSFRTDPITLNNWMAHNITNLTKAGKSNSGYSSGSPYDDTNQVNWTNPTHVKSAGVDPATLIQYAEKNGIDMRVQSNLFGNNTVNDELLNKAMCDLNPAILGVNSGNHYVAATGKTKYNDKDTWRLHDPLATAPTNLLQAYGSNSYGRQVIFNGNKPNKALLLSLYSPAEILITNPEGQTTGFEPQTGLSFEEIPFSSYGQEFLAADSGTPEVLERKILYIDTPMDGEYTIRVIGTGSGIIGLDIIPIDTNGDGQRITISDIVVPGVENVYRFSYSSIPNQQSQLIRSVTIDIKPGEVPNPVNPKSRDVVPVAILSTGNFDATNVDFRSVKFGPTGALAVDRQPSLEDINGDGFLDMVLHFPVRKTGIVSGMTEACISGKTFWQLDFSGCDDIKTVP